VRLFDSHAHLTDERFADDLPETLSRASAEGVEAIVTIASDLEDADAAIAIAETSERPAVWATAGIHPHMADRWDPAAADALRALAGADRVVAIGETGLDFHYENAPRDAQLRAFRDQLELARDLDLPLVVHSRDADSEMGRVIRERGTGVRGVLHCFTGGPDLMRAGLEAGWYVSFSGIVTFSSYRDLEVVRVVPDDRVLAETDSPYLAPVPRRGRRNEPAFVAHVVDRLAEVRDVAVEELAERTWRNARRFYGLHEGEDEG
jgi:TatD DNase family protein